jgi:protein-arginine deiminase
MHGPNLDDQILYPLITVFADFDHDGLIDATAAAGKSAGQSGPFGIVPVIPHEAAVRSCEREGFKLAGATQPICPAPVRIRFNSPLSQDIKLVLQVSAEAQGRACLFRRRADGWDSLGLEGTWRLEAHNLTEIELGLAAVPSTRQSRSLSGYSWARIFHLRVALVTKEAKEIFHTSICFKIPPLLLASSLDKVEEVLVIRNELSSRFVAELEDLLAHTGVRVHAIDYSEVPDDLWIQDTVSILRMCVPSWSGEQQIIAAFVGLRSKSKMIQTSPLDRYVKTYFGRLNALLLEAGEARDNSRWIDWYGNLQVSPPVKDVQGREFPYGRILTGRQNDLSIHPELLSLLEMQGCQWPPVVIDASWLRIGHVDEVVNFIPANDGPLFRALIPSPRRARKILTTLVSRGYADAPVFVGRKDQTTVAQLLEEVAASEENSHIEDVLRQIRSTLCQGLGIGDEHFIEMPVLFRRGIAVIPNSVNSLVCNQQIIIPDPTGPQINGQDPFAAAIRQSLEPLGLQVHLVDDWEPFHARGGEIHCGTNAIRRIGGPRGWES